MKQVSLPVDDALPDLARSLKSHACVVLVAPPGSGKTTRVAPGLIDRGFVPPGQQAWLLQPRRLAARATATRISAERETEAGGETGYQVRFEKRWGPSTRLVVATEGILLRRLEDDPLLSGTTVVLLDEFHERSLNGDLLLAMLRRVQLAGRDDLKLVVMSATLDSGPVREYLGGAPLIEAKGLEHEVEFRHSPVPAATGLVDHVVSAVLRAAERDAPDLLVFLPGMAEILATRNRLAGQLRDWRIEILHGSLPLEQQAAVLQRDERPRAILSTNIAETSLTIDGVRTVIDSGLARVMRFDPGVGLDRLELEPICQASARQRAGRAGRTAAGVCVRLWDQAAQRSRPEFLEPEVRRIDVAAAVLQLLAWGERPESFPWFEAPRTEAVGAALRLLHRLQAIDGTGRLTAAGKSMARLPVAPRLARLLLAGHALGHLETVCLAAAMLAERDPFLRGRSGGVKGPGTVTATSRWACDVTERLTALRGWLERGESQSRFGEVHRGAAAGIGQVARELLDDCRKMLGAPPPPGCPVEEAVPRALLLAMPDRVARKREGANKWLMAGGRGLRPGPLCGVAHAELVVGVELMAAAGDAVVHQASAVQREWLDPSLVTIRDDLFFSPSARAVQQRRRELWDDLVLAETPVAISDVERAAETLFEAARRALSDVQPDNGAAIRSFAARVSLLRSAAPEMELSACDEALQLDVLRELCAGRRSFDQLRAAPWLDWLRNRYRPDQLAAIEREAPERIRVPAGNQHRIEYVEGKPPVLAVRIQEIFSWQTTPRIAFGRVPLLLHLLAPNQRPQQVTDDLASFWRNGYPQVRGELRRRYPKHAWPEDPAVALPKKA